MAHHHIPQQSSVRRTERPRPAETDRGAHQATQPGSLPLIRLPRRDFLFLRMVTTDTVRRLARLIPRQLLLALLLSCGALRMTALPAPALAASATVSTCDQSHLQSAITAAGDGGTVTFACSGDIPFSNFIAITQNVTIDGSGQSVTLDGQGSAQIFFINTGVSLSLNNLTLTNAHATRSGGAISNFGTLTVNNSTVSNSSAGSFGGGIYSFQGSLTVTNSTFSGNGADGNSGGAIESYQGTLSVTNSTFYGNHTDNAGTGGAIYNNSSATVSDSTFSGNHANGGFGGAIFNSASLTITATVLSGDSAPNGPECWGTVTANYDFIENTAGCTILGNDNFTGQSANLSPLGYYGGPTPTMPLISPTGAANPAVDYVPVTDCSTVDQRGYPRPDFGEGFCDIGATEFQDASSTTTVSRCSEGDLRQAIADTSSGGTVFFNCDGDIVLGSVIQLAQSVNLDGNGHRVTIDGNNSVSLFLVGSGITLGLNRLTLANGNGGASTSEGGAITNTFGSVQISNSTLMGNHADGGYGGAIENSGSLTITNSTLSGNHADNGYGGAIQSNASATVTVSNSTFSGNHATGGNGGAIFNVNGSSAITLTADILSGDTASTGPECSGSFTPNYSLIQNTAGCTISGGSNLTGQAANLYPLGTYGGPTQTMPLIPGNPANPAMDYVPSSSCPSTDQRGYTRSDGGEAVCDIGSTEYQDPAICASKPTISASNQMVNGQYQLQLTVRDATTGLDAIEAPLGSPYSSNINQPAIPAFATGTRDGITFNVVKTDPSQTSKVTVIATNHQGCLLDPVMAGLVINQGRTTLQRFDGIAQNETQLQIANGQPGLQLVAVLVNGRQVLATRLRSGQTWTASMAGALKPGNNNQISVLGVGPTGAEAGLMVSPPQ